MSLNQYDLKTCGRWEKTINEDKEQQGVDFSGRRDIFLLDAGVYGSY